MRINIYITIISIIIIKKRKSTHTTTKITFQGGSSGILEIIHKRYGKKKKEKNIINKMK